MLLSLRPCFVLKGEEEPANSGGLPFAVMVASLRTTLHQTLPHAQCLFLGIAFTSYSFGM
jgi:hypothetical protein